jgi:hypothetical protein
VAPLNPTLMNPYRALAALLYGKWLQRRARREAARQIQWGLNYIRQRYGTHGQAWDYWQGGDPPDRSNP